MLVSMGMMSYANMINLQEWSTKRISVLNDCIILGFHSDSDVMYKYFIIACILYAN